ncbi:MAG: YXWGXW repeat-containing protein [Verrucomicrobiota bacterium]
MKISKYFTVLAATTLPLFAGFSQTAPTAIASQTKAASTLSPGAAEVEKLARSGVSDEVVLSFIGQSQSYYNLSAADITGLKDAGVSAQAMTAMLNHDGALHIQQPSLTTAASTPGSSQLATTQSGPFATTTISNTTPATATAVIAPATPAPQVEVIPVTPGPNYVWTPGWWSWNGRAWIWFGGYWGFPTRPGHVWINGNFYHGWGHESFREHRR